MGSKSGTATSREGGVPTRLPPPATGARQLSFALAGAPERPPRSEPLPGVVHITNWLSFEVQHALVADFRRWALPPAGLRHPRVPTGHRMTVQSVCLGWHWQPYLYSRTANDTDSAPVKPLPRELFDLARTAVAAAYGATSAEAASFAPDAAIVNLYAPGAHLGLHQDGEEPSDAPVVTLSLGDSCLFRFAGVDRRTSPFVDLTLRSGDLLVFGRETRRIFHGVPKVLNATSPPDLGLPPGRLSITVRETGLAEVHR